MTYRAAQMIVANGFPKAGGHALVKALQLLGIGVPSSADHYPHGTLPHNGAIATKHVFIKRDPRNVVVSMLRWLGEPVTQGTVIAKFRLFQSRSLVEEMSEFEPYLAGPPNTLVVRYEDLIASSAEMQRIADFLGVPYIMGAFEELPGLTKTYRGPQHSDYRRQWTERVREAWRAGGGDELVERWGYTWNS